MERTGDIWHRRFVVTLRDAIADPRRAVDGLSNVLVASAFVLATAFPLIGIAVLPSSFQSSVENRLPAPFPQLNTAGAAQYFRDFEQWFADRFALRRTLIHAATLTKLSIGVSPSKNVVVGRDGWLFYAGENALAQFQREIPFSEVELRTWCATFEARRTWLAARGIRYLIVIPPNKETVYPDFMPVELTRANRPSRLDQFIDYVQGHSRVDVLDLRGALATARRTERVYAATDTHWNDAGAFVTSRAITERVHDWFPKVEPLPSTAVTTTRHLTPGGDLSGLIALKDDVPETEHVTVTVSHPRSRVADPGVPTDAQTPEHLQPRARETDDPSLPRAVVLKDSFMNSVVPFLSESFRRTVYLATHDFDRETIRHERPDVVIEEMLERFLMMGVPLNPPDLDEPESPENSMGDPPGMDSPHTSGAELSPRSEWSVIDLETAAGGGFLADGPDPSITIPTSSLIASAHPTLWIKLRAEPGDDRQRGTGVAQLFFSANGAGFSEPSSVKFPILIDEIEHAYRVTPSLSGYWRGDIDHVRLDFPDLEPGIRYWVSSVAVGE